MQYIFIYCIMYCQIQNKSIYLSITLRCVEYLVPWPQLKDKVTQGA